MTTTDLGTRWLSLGIDLSGGRTAIAASDGRLPPVATLLDEDTQPASDSADDWDERLRKAIERVQRNGASETPTRCVLALPPHVGDADRRRALDAVEAWVDRGLVCSQPFAIVYGLDRSEEPTLIIDIDERATHLYLMDGNQPQVAEHSTLAQGVEHLDHDLVRRIQAAHPGVQVTTWQARALRERHASLVDPGQAIIAALPHQGRAQAVDVTDIMLAACWSLTQPLIAALREMLWACDPVLREALRRNVLIVGSGASIGGLEATLQDGLSAFGGGRVRALSQPRYAGCRGALKIASDLSETAWARVAGA